MTQAQELVAVAVGVMTIVGGLWALWSKKIVPALKEHQRRDRERQRREQAIEHVIVGRHYGLISPTDTFTSIAVAQPLHGYIHYGLVGLILMSLICGFTYRLLSAFILEPSTSAAGPGLCLYCFHAFALATSVGTIWLLGFMGLVKAVTLLTLLLVVAAMVGRVLARLGESTPPLPADDDLARIRHRLTS